jgi:hypothetical protein
MPRGRSVRRSVAKDHGVGVYFGLHGSRDHISGNGSVEAKECQSLRWVSKPDEVMTMQQLGLSPTLHELLPIARRLSRPSARLHLSREAIPDGGWWIDNF